MAERPGPVRRPPRRWHWARLRESFGEAEREPGASATLRRKPRAAGKSPADERRTQNVACFDLTPLDFYPSLQCGGGQGAMAGGARSLAIRTERGAPERATDLGHTAGDGRRHRGGRPAGVRLRVSIQAGRWLGVGSNDHGDQLHGHRGGHHWRVRSGRGRRRGLGANDLPNGGARQLCGGDGDRGTDQNLVGTIPNARGAGRNG